MAGEQMKQKIGITAKIARQVNMGGLICLYLDWALSLQAAGCEVLWLEIGERPPREDAGSFVSSIEEDLNSFGLRSRVLLCLRGDPYKVVDSSGRVLSVGKATAGVEVLFNLAYELDPSFVESFGIKAFFDLDPGLMQLWIDRGHLTLPRHDLYFTLSETVANGEARAPDCGIRWHHVRPPVYLPAWPVSMRANPEAPFTTVTSWWGKKEQDWISWNGELMNNEKRTAFLEFLELPSRVDIPLELAVTLTEETPDLNERGNLERHGWRVLPLWNKEWTPEAYRGYVRSSRGEFSCCKPLYSRLETAMIFPRTLHYLASGKPVVIQQTGPMRYLPQGAGVFHFSTVDDAQRALAEIASDYERHARAARHLAEEHFDGRKVVREVLDVALS